MDDSSPSTAVATKPKRTRVKKATKKKSPEARQQAEKRIALEKRIFQLQQLLIDTNVSETVLKEAAALFQPQQYLDVVEERAIDMCCGYPTCNKKRPQIKGPVPKYKLSLSTKRVFDNSELSLYCGPECLIASKLYTSQLLEVPVYLRTPEDLKSVESIKFVSDITESSEENTLSSKLHASVVSDVHNLIMPYGGSVDIEKVQARLEILEREDVPPTATLPPSFTTPTEPPKSNSSLSLASTPTPQTSTPTPETSTPLPQTLTPTPQAPTLPQTPTPDPQTSTPTSQASTTNPASTAQTNPTDTAPLEKQITNMKLDNAQPQRPPSKFKENRTKTKTEQPTQKSSTHTPPLQKPSSMRKTNGNQAKAKKKQVQFQEEDTDTAPDASVSGDSDSYSEEDMSLFGMQDSSDDEPLKATMSSFGLLWTTLDNWKTPATVSFLYPKKETPVAEDDESASIDSEQVFLPNHSQNALRRQALVASISPHFSSLRSSLQLDYVVDQDAVPLISTFSMAQALPSFSPHQWKTVALLLIELLSQQNAILTKQLKEFLNNKKRILSECNINYDEYQVLLDIFCNK